MNPYAPSEATALGPYRGTSFGPVPAVLTLRHGPSVPLTTALAPQGNAPDPTFGAPRPGALQLAARSGARKGGARVVVLDNRGAKADPIILSMFCESRGPTGQRPIYWLEYANSSVPKTLFGAVSAYGDTATLVAGREQTSDKNVGEGVLTRLKGEAKDSWNQIYP